MEVDDREAFEQAVAGVPEHRHRVIVSDLRHLSADIVIPWLAVANSHPIEEGATFSAVAVITPGELGFVDLAMTELSDAHLIALARYTSTSLPLWATDAGSGFARDDMRDRLLAITGGWPDLVDEVVTHARVVGADRALAELGDDLAERPAWFLGRVGLDDDRLRGLWDALMPAASERPMSSAEMIGLLGVGGGGETALRALKAAGVLVEQEDGSLMAEPIAAQAWRAARASD